MQCKAVGFYWTLPVPWTGFRTLPDDLEQAVQQSRTIRYQRELVRRCTRKDGYDLVREDVFVELAPDRGGKHIREPLDTLAAFCRQHEATLFYVDFSEAQRWRSHETMSGWFADADVPLYPVGLGNVMIEGKLFDPVEHFERWRARDKLWRADKPAREAAARQEALGLKDQGLTWPAIAAHLNHHGLSSATGRSWTADNLRKLLKSG